MWVGFHQTFESLNRTKKKKKKRRNSEFALSLNWNINLLLLWDINAPVSQAFELGPRLTLCAPQVQQIPCHRSVIKYRFVLFGIYSDFLIFLVPLLVIYVF